MSSFVASRPLWARQYLMEPRAMAHESWPRSELGSVRLSAATFLLFNNASLSSGNFSAGILNIDHS